MTSVAPAVAVGLFCALLSALGTNLAFLFKYRGAVAAPDVDVRHPLRSAIELFRSKWWSIGWGVAAVAFALHVAALTLAPISIGQAVLAGGLVFLAVRRGTSSTKACRSTSRPRGCWRSITIPVRDALGEWTAHGGTSRGIREPCLPFGAVARDVPVPQSRRRRAHPDRRTAVSTTTSRRSQGIRI